MSAISFDEGSRTWLLETRRSSYGIQLDGEARLPRHLHWGGRVGHRALAAMATGQPTSDKEQIGRDEEPPLEIVAWGGRRYDEPTLKVEFADGDRVLELEYLSGTCLEQGDGEKLTLSLRDRIHPFEVELHYRVFFDSDVIERWMTLRNEDPQRPVVVHRAYSASWWFPERASWRMTFLRGGWGWETQIAQRSLAGDKAVLESRRGATGHQYQPFLALDAGDAGEEGGQVWSCQVAWSGSWRLICEETAVGRVHVSGGWNEFDMPLLLSPGRELALPVFAGLYTAGGLGAMTALWHEYELGHVLANPCRQGALPSFPEGSTGRRGPATARPAVRPVLYNSWEATSFAVDEDEQARLAELASSVGVELFVVDDGWFQNRADHSTGLGDWTPDEQKFPNGLKPLIERVRELGMRFGLWVEPEMVNPDSDLYRAHPDWVYHFPSRRRSEQRSQLVLNLARRDVADWVYQRLEALLAGNDISFLKWDHNRDFSEVGWPEEVGRNPERAWIEHTRNLYCILERLRDAFPDVQVETCAGGGGRVDLGMLARTAQAWTSDDTDAWDRLAIQEGFALLHAPLAMVAWVTDSPNHLTGRRLPLRYRFHAAMAGALGIGADLSEWTGSELDEARSFVAQYKRIRELVQLGRYERLSPIAEESVRAVQFVGPQAAELVAFAWTGVRRHGPLQTCVRLRGLDPSAVYVDQDTGAEHLGAVLTERGLLLPQELDFASFCVHLRRAL